MALTRKANQEPDNVALKRCRKAIEEIQNSGHVLEEDKENDPAFLLSQPTDQEELHNNLMNFQKYCSVNKLKDETRAKIDKLEAEKRVFMADYEKRRRALWRNFYKFKDAGSELEGKLENVVTNTDEKTERAIRLEILGSDTDVN